MADEIIPEHEWTDEEGTWRAVGDEVFEVIPRNDPRKRSAASALGAGKSPRPAAAREILRLAAENDELNALRVRIETVMARDGYQDMTLADLRKTIAVGRIADRASIRRELLAEIDPKLAALKARNKGAGVDPLTVHDSACIGLLSELRRAVDRICPAGPEEG